MSMPSAQTLYSDCTNNGGDPNICLSQVQTIYPNYTPSGGANGWDIANNIGTLSNDLLGLVGGIWGLADPQRFANNNIQQPIQQQDNTPIYIGMGLIFVLIMLLVLYLIFKK